jgi:hypothetical protein
MVFELLPLFLIKPFCVPEKPACSGASLMTGRAGVEISIKNAIF